MLHDAFDQAPLTAAQRATESADDACRDRRLETERVADRDHQLPDPKRPRSGQLRIGQRARLSTQHREVRRRIPSDDHGGDVASIDERDARLLDVLHDVLIGEHIAVGSDDNARSRAAPRARGLIRAADVDTDDRRTRRARPHRRPPANRHPGVVG